MVDVILLLDKTVHVEKRKRPNNFVSKTKVYNEIWHVEKIVIENLSSNLFLFSTTFLFKASTAIFGSFSTGAMLLRNKSIHLLPILLISKP